MNNDLVAGFRNLLERVERKVAAKEQQNLNNFDSAEFDTKKFGSVIFLLNW